MHLIVKRLQAWYMHSFAAHAAHTILMGSVVMFCAQCTHAQTNARVVQLINCATKTSCTQIQQIGTLCLVQYQQKKSAVGACVRECDKAIVSE